MKSHFGKHVLAAAVTASLGSAWSVYAVGGEGIGAYGQPVPTSQANNAIEINRGSKYANVRENDVVKFVDAKTAQSFAWVFQLTAPVNFALSEIAPAGFPAGDTRVYVRERLPRH